MYENYTIVKLTKDLASYKKGSIASIVEVYEKPPGYIIEMHKPHPSDHGIVDVYPDEIEEVKKE